VVSWRNRRDGNSLTDADHSAPELYDGLVGAQVTPDWSLHTTPKVRVRVAIGPQGYRTAKPSDSPRLIRWTLADTVDLYPF
jgi:hypothetical protein